MTGLLQSYQLTRLQDASSLHAQRAELPALSRARSLPLRLPSRSLCLTVQASTVAVASPPLQGSPQPLQLQRTSSAPAGCPPEHWSGTLPNCRGAAVVSVAGCENGRPKPANQDSFLTHAVHPCSAAILGVMDGHGRQGHVASARVRDAMLSALEPCARQAFTADKQPRAADQPWDSHCDQDPQEPPSPHSTYGNLGTSTALSASMAAELTPDSAQACLGATFSRAADAMRAAAAEFMHSGTTAVLCMVLQDSVVAAWAGDSRAVLGVAEPDGQGYKAQDLTKDHKPNNLTEMARIVAAGGRVSRTAKDRDGNPIGPFRVYLPTGRSPGLSVARAFGDTLLSSVGVVPHPDFAVFRLPQQQPSTPASAAAAAGATDAPGARPSHILIVATDGLWEFISSEEAVEIAAAAESPEQAAQLLGEAARQAWHAAWGGLHIDDVTIAVAFL